MRRSVQGRIAVPRRTFGVQEPSAQDEGPRTEPTLIHRVLARLWSRSDHRPNNLSAPGETGGDEAHSRVTPPIPHMRPSSGEVFATPLPTLSMVVLSITMLGEFLCANVSTPFLLFMVKGFGEVNGDAEVAFWTGIIVSTFFLTQFITSILWATIAEKHGQRTVLIISLLGSAVTCLVFGTATTLRQAISIRLLQGIFAGAIGVARGSVVFITDRSNEGRAYAILGFCWGLGGVAGAIVGGAFERPAVKWPELFQGLTLFAKYPYLLPCAVAALITFSGAFLACFLGRDGGPREGAIKLGPEKLDAISTIPEEESVPPSPVLESPERKPSFVKSLWNKFTSLLGRHSTGETSFDSNSSLTSTLPLATSPLGSEARTFSSRANGTAYGYSGEYRNRPTSNVNLDARRRSIASSSRRRRGGSIDGVWQGITDNVRDLNFAQRLLMANEHAVTNIADLWVAAAMNVDNEDLVESDTEAESDGEPDLPQAIDQEEESTSTGSSSQPVDPRMTRSSSYMRSSLTPQHPVTRTPAVRRSSATRSIFAHPGVKTPRAVLDAQQLLLRPVDSESLVIDLLHSGIRRTQDDVESLAEKPPSLASQIPVRIIVQYGMLALHATTHDQVYLSYLVSDYDSGGLNLNAGHFAELIALMCLAQIAYQFYLYPNMGPPRGRFSHLAMFRMGSFLFIPAYLSVILYRPFANANDAGNMPVMSALALSTAIRFCGSTFGYTSISILLNYMTPPAAVGFANGIAQSIVSLARCVGPVIGGYLWSMSIQDGPSGYAFGFTVCASFCAFTIVHSYLIR